MDKSKLSTDLGSMLNAVAATVNKQCVLQPAGWNEVFVTIDLDSNPVFTTFVDEWVASANMCAAAHGSPLEYTSEEMSKYLATITYARVMVCRDGKNYQGITWRDNLNIPAFFSLVLEHIGRVEDESLGLTLIPDMEEPGCGLMSRDELIAFSRKLVPCKNWGKVFATQMPRDRKGDWHFMTVQHVSESYLSHSRDAEPVKALFASVVNMEGLMSVLSPRVTYGNTGLFSRIVREFV